MFKLSNDKQFVDVATGKVIDQCMKHHRHQEWLRFLRLLDRSTKKALDLHLPTSTPL